MTKATEKLSWKSQNSEGLHPLWKVNREGTDLKPEERVRSKVVITASLILAIECRL